MDLDNVMSSDFRSTMNNTRDEYTLNVDNHDRKDMMFVGSPTPQNIDTQLSNLVLRLAVQVN